MQDGSHKSHPPANANAKSSRPQRSSHRSLQTYTVSLCWHRIVSCKSYRLTGNWLVLKAISIKFESLLHPFSSKQNCTCRKEEIQNTIKSYRASRAPHSERDASTTGSNALHKSGYPEEPPGKRYMRDQPRDKGPTEPMWAGHNSKNKKQW